MDSTPTPSERPVSKRRTPPAWPPTPSDKPTCEHGQIEEHSFLAQVRIGRIGNGVHYTTETMWCPGPVIATEPEPQTFAESIQAAKVVAEKIMSGEIDEPETPVSDPTPDLRERVAKVMYAHDHDASPVFSAQEYAETVDAVLMEIERKP